MAFRIYALIKSKNKIIGYKLLDENNTHKIDLRVKDVKNFIKGNQFSNAKVNLEDYSVTLTESTTKRMPYVDLDDGELHNNKISVLCKYIGSKGVCFLVCNGYGNLTYMDLGRLIKAESTLGLSNAKIVPYKGKSPYVAGLKHSIPINGLDLYECLLVTLVSGHKVTVRDGDFLLLDENNSIVEIASSLLPRWLAPKDKFTYSDLLEGYHNTCVNYNSVYSEDRHKKLMEEIGTGFTWCFKTFVNSAFEKFYLLEKKVKSLTNYGGVGVFSKKDKKWLIPPYFEFFNDNIKQLTPSIIIGSVYVEDPILKLEVDELYWLINIDTGVRSSIKYTSVEVVDNNTLKVGVFGKDNSIEIVELDAKTLIDTSDKSNKYVLTHNDKLNE